MKIRIWALLCCLLLMWTSLPLTASASGMRSTEWKESDALSVAAMWMIRTDTDEKKMESAEDSCVPTATLLECAEAKTAGGQAETVLLGGMPFGVKFFTEGVTVVGFGEVETAEGSVHPAALAGLRIKDVILAVDGTPLDGARDLTARIEGCEGKELRLTCRRAGKELTLTLTPVYCPAESRYKTGVWVRDSGAGIGTVTFIRPEDGAFAGLGHGICDGDTGELIGMRRGVVSDVTISTVIKGAAGAPGELKGYFNAGKTGALVGNTSCGVWGVLTRMPEGATERVEVGGREELSEGAAEILCTLDTNRIGRYAVQIRDIKRDCKGSKCFTVQVTDPALLSVTGGIVQGMSGSPIIQNGKLVGAVTHVLVGDPTTGYGIFIENMLSAANIPMAKAS